MYRRGVNRTPCHATPRVRLVVLFPIVGTLSALGLIWLLARNDRSHGTSAVIESVTLHGGRLSARALLTKVFSAAIFIGSGGSAGPEDPSVQLGGVVGSKIAQLFRLSEKRTRTLVASGVAGAVAAAFNAPIAGVFFALEVVIGELSSTLFPPVVLAAVAASAISRWLNGNHPAFHVPGYDLGSALFELPLYAVLGILSAIVGVTFIRLLFLVEDSVARVRPTRIMRGISIGLLIGLVALWLPDVIGVGYGTVGAILVGRISEGGQLATLVGILTTSDIARAMEANVDAGSPVRDIATTDLLVAYTEQTLHDAIPLFALRDVQQLPVVTREQPRQLVGMLRHADIVRSYSAGIVRRAERGR